MNSDDAPDAPGLGGADELAEWGLAAEPFGGGPAMGDAALVRPLDGGLLVGVIDGLGHGHEAAEAASVAIAVLGRAARPAVAQLVRECHEAMRKTRGGVLAVAFLDGASSRMAWAGVGNVEGLLWRGSQARPTETLLSLGGIVGYQLPRVRESTVAIEPGDTLVLATDGIRSSVRDVAPRGAPRAFAEDVLAGHSRGTDDALVVVVRYLGART